MENKEHIKNLFSKYLNGEYTQEDLDALLHYFNVDDNEYDLKDLIEQELKNEYDLTAYSAEIKEVDQFVRKALYRKITPLQRRTIPYLKIAAGIAAVFLLALTIVYFNRDLPADNNIVNESIKDISPGTNRATLILDSGKPIVLREDKEGIQINADNITYSDGTNLTESNQTQYATLIVPRAGQYQVTLPDGTKVWLNAQTTLKYPVKFRGTEREVEMQGEAYFEVTRNPRQPFVIKSNEQTVKVLGTSFNINTFTGRATTTLINGRVQLSNNKQTKILIPGQQAVETGDSFDVKNVNVENYTSWKEGILVLNNQNIHDILKQLERWYDVEFINTSSLNSKEALSGDIPRDINLSGILQALEQQMQIKFKIEGRRIMVSK